MFPSFLWRWNCLWWNCKEMVVLQNALKSSNRVSVVRPFIKEWLNLVWIHSTPCSPMIPHTAWCIVNMWSSTGDTSLSLWTPSAYVHAFSLNHTILCVMHASAVYVYYKESLNLNAILHICMHASQCMYVTGLVAHLVCPSILCTYGCNIMNWQKADGEGVNWHFKHVVVH